MALLKHRCSLHHHFRLPVIANLLASGIFNAPFFLGESTIFRHVSPFFSIYPTGKVSFLPRSTSSFRRSLRTSRMTSLRRAQEPPANGGSTGREASPAL